MFPCTICELCSRGGRQAIAAGVRGVMVPVGRDVSHPARIEGLPNLESHHALLAKEDVVRN